MTSVPDLESSINAYAGIDIFTINGDLAPARLSIFFLRPLRNIPIIARQKEGNEGDVKAVVLLVPCEQHEPSRAASAALTVPRGDTVHHHPLQVASESAEGIPVEVEGVDRAMVLDTGHEGPAPAPGGRTGADPEPGSWHRSSS